MRHALLVVLLTCACSNAESRATPAADATSDTDKEWDPTPNDAALEERDTPRPECTSLTDAGSAFETGSPMQAWCELATTNAPSCPASPPTPGDACTSDGLTCRYGLDATYAQLARCSKGKWMLMGASCASKCSGLDGGTTTLPAAPACGSQPSIPCAPDDRFTDYERAMIKLRQLATCCGGMNENVLLARFADGCVQSLEVLVPDPASTAFVACLTNLVAGRRLACAPSTCIAVEWSTVK